MKKFLMLILAAAVGWFGYAAPARSATESWVKRYVASMLESGEFLQPATPETLAETPVLSGEFTDPDDPTIVYQLKYTAATNIALLVADSSVADVPNGTLWAWDEDGQQFYNRGFGFMPRLVKETRKVTLTSAAGNSYVGDAVFYTGEDDNGDNWLTYFNGGTYLRCGNDLSKHFRLNLVTITESEKNALLAAPLAASVFIHPLTGEAVEVRSRAVSNETGGTADNIGGDFTLSVTYKGAKSEIRLGQPPKDLLPCDVTDGNGNLCQKMRYNFETWNDPKKWGLSFPITITFSDGTSKTYSEGLFKQMSGWTSWLSGVIEQARQAHLPHKFEEPHTHEHEHKRGKDCYCSWKCDVKVKGEACDYECPEFMKHEGTRDERKLPAAWDSLGVNTWCEWGCLNPDCREHKIDHGILLPVPTDGVDPMTGEPAVVSYIHSCACGAEQGDHFRFKREEQTTPEGGKIVTYRCDEFQGGCGYDWVERQDAEEHDHRFTTDANDNEYCFVTVYAYAADGAIVDEKECGQPNPHALVPYLESECVKCSNTLFDDSECPYKEHRGLWQDIDDDEYHACSCGAEIENHGFINDDEFEIIKTNGLNVVTLTITEWDCPAPPKGCGHHFSITNETGFAKLEGHYCSKPPYNDREDGCAEANERDGKCRCKQHPEHQLAHEEKEGMRLDNECAKCKFCGQPVDESGAERSKHSKTLRSRDFGDVPKSEQLGHECTCGKYRAGHNFDEGKATIKPQGGKIVNAVKYTCKDCGFSYESTDEEDCGHGYRELDEDGNALGDFVSLWNDCVCSNCGVHRDHAFGGSPIEQPNACPLYRCQNKNGEQFGGDLCSATTNLVTGVHIGWSDLDAGSEAESPTELNGHKCFCSAEKVEYHRMVDTQGEWECEVRVACPLPPNGCGHDFPTLARHSPDNLKFCGKTMLCEVCGRKYEKGEWVAATPEDHSFGGKKHDERTTCKCDCGMITSHYFAPDRASCACACGESVNHIRGTNPICKCTGAPAELHPKGKEIIKHGAETSSDETETHQCPTCAKNWTDTKTTFTCVICGDITRVVTEAGTHDCTNGEVKSGTVKLKWDEYRGKNPDTGEMEDVPAGEKEEPWSGGGYGGGDAWMRGASVSADGATIKLGESGFYKLRAKIDDGGGVTVGGLSAGAGASWRDWGEWTIGWLDAGTANVSASASSGEGLVGFEYEFVYVGKLIAGE